MTSDSYFRLCRDESIMQCSLVRDNQLNTNFVNLPLLACFKLRREKIA